MYANCSILRKFIYFIPVIPVYLVIYTVVYTFTYYYLLDNSLPLNFKKIGVSILFYTFAIMTFICHTVSMVTNPGEIDSKILINYIKNGDAPVPTDNNSLICKQCLKERPERAHHCRNCQKCFLKMDHHCPWIANCVGYFNQKAFYLFLFYATIGDLIACICFIFRIMHPSFVNMLIYPKRRINPQAEYLVLEVLASLQDPILIVIGSALSFAMSMAIGALFIYQTYLIMNNMTSIESSSLEKKEDSPYYCGKKILMWRSVMGLNNNFLMWFIPSFEPNKINGGYIFNIPGGKERKSFFVKKKNSCKECKDDNCTSKDDSTNNEDDNNNNNSSNNHKKKE